MSYLIDSHCHLHDREFFSEEQAEAMLERARKNNVRRIICIGTDPEDSLKARDFAATHENVYWTYGVHPEEWAKDADKFCRDEKLVGIGEIGLDYHTEGYNREAQIRLLEEQLQLATDNNLPVSFHVRKAYPDFFGIIANFPSVRGVLHSFTDSKKMLKRALNETDFYIGVNGLATYTTLPTPPLSRILLETDAPFLTPEPFRGIINEAAYIRNIAEWLAAKLGVTFEAVEYETTRNAEKLFRFPDSVVREERGV